MEARIDEIGAGIYRLSIFVPIPLRPPDLRIIISCSPVTNRCCFTAGSEKCFHWFPLRLLGSCRWSDYAGLVSAISKRMNADR